MQFVKAVRKNIKARVALIGPAGGGKTWNALEIAKVLGGRTAGLDSEHGSMKKYADTFEFDVLELETFSPAKYIEVIELAEKAGYDNLIIDSLSHAWMGKDGALEMVDRAAARSRSGNSFMAWREVTPEHNALVEAMLAAKLNLIITMRTKAEYVIEEDDRGKKVPRKIGLQPVQRDGLDYEFDVTIDLDMTNTMIVGKSRCAACPPGTIFKMPQVGTKFAKVLKEWLAEGKAEAPTERPKSQPPEPAASRPAGPGPGDVTYIERTLAEGDAEQVEKAKSFLRVAWNGLPASEQHRLLKLVQGAQARLAAPPSPPADLDPTPQPEPAQAPEPPPEREPVRDSIVEGLVGSPTPPDPSLAANTTRGPVLAKPEAGELASVATMEQLADSFRTNGIRQRAAVDKYVAANVPGKQLNNLSEEEANGLIMKLGELGMARLSGGAS